MKHRQFAMMAMMFALNSEGIRRRLIETNSYKEALAGTRFRTANVGNNPIYIPTKSQQIKRKRRLARNY